jgi:hypothetical protein
MKRSGFVSLLCVVWLVIGVIVAANHHYFADLKTLGAVLSALVAILLWPLILLGTARRGRPCCTRVGCRGIDKRLAITAH